MKTTAGYKKVAAWLKQRGWKAAAFQLAAFEAYLNGKSGLLNAATGSGKTYALWLPILIRAWNEQLAGKKHDGLQVLWITPLRALAKDIQRNMQQACDELGLAWEVGIRTGDTTARERGKQKQRLPPALIITPESVHVLLAREGSSNLFRQLHTIIVDEWHELMGSKRGVQTELALAHLRYLRPDLQLWGISATIGNLEQARDVLLGIHFPPEQTTMVIAAAEKKLSVQSILPDKVETLPWAGYLGINMVDKVVAVVRRSKTTLLFTNTRSQTEIWYRTILDKYPEFAGLMALHHGSLDKEMRSWVEDALHRGKLRLVICTSSLDLGVDFRPVETVIQVGSPKSLSRFIQRAGRSGHRPGARSRIYFTPTSSLELIEAVSLRTGVAQGVLEERLPVVHAFDVLAQWMVTLAVGDGFDEQQLFRELKSTYAYQLLEPAEWKWLLRYITTGSAALTAYDEFRKVELESGRYKVLNRQIAQRHLMSMGTIVAETALKVQFAGGRYLGSIEESFITRLKPGDTFWFAGMNLEYVQVRGMAVTVRRSAAKKGIVPQWLGGRMPLSSTLSRFIRERLSDALENPYGEAELKKMQPLLEVQRERSAIPAAQELLIEQYESREGHHIFIFPFEGRLVHEGMAVLLAYRISKWLPITFSIAMNDYGFELLSDQYVDIASLVSKAKLFSTEGLREDIYHSVNATEMARRKFREIATIAGLMFQGFPGRQIKAKQLQSSSSLLFDVMREYEQDNLFIRQAFQEVFEYQLEELRLRDALERTATQQLLFRQTGKPSPFSFPILVDRLREQLSSEKLEDRIAKMIRQYDERN